MKALDLTEPAFALGFGDTGNEVVTDIDQVMPWRWWRQWRARLVGVHGVVHASAGGDATEPA